MLVLLGLWGCPKPVSVAEPVAPTVIQVPARVYDPLPNAEAAGHAALPRQVRDVRALATMLHPNGDLWIGGGAVVVAQYQWLLRVPAVGDAKHVVIDPGGVNGLGLDSEGSGVFAVGKVGGFVVERGFFARLEEFGGVWSRQAYLSEGTASLRHVAEAAGGRLYLAGQVEDAAGAQGGWVLAVNREGSEQWGRTYGIDGAGALHWVTPREDGVVAVGERDGPSGRRAGWYLALDGEGEVQAQQVYESDGWLGLRDGFVLEDGSVLTAGLQHALEPGPIPAAAPLRLSRISADGTEEWSHVERPVASLGRLVRWGDGAAIAVRVEDSMMELVTWVVQIAPDGTLRWVQQASIPTEANHVELHETLQGPELLAVVCTTEGVWWGWYPVVP